MAFAYEKAQKFLLFYRFHGRGLSTEDWRDVCFRIESCVFTSGSSFTRRAACVLHQAQIRRPGQGLTPVSLFSLPNSTRIRT